MAHEILVKSILNKVKHRDSWFLVDYTANFYSGCSFNCLYCYVRGSKYGIHMERSLSVKVNAIDILERQLRNKAKKGMYGFIGLCSATDPYLHFEKDHEITREALKVILKYRFPVHILTKSDLIERDFDLLKQIDREAILPRDLSSRLNRGVIISFSFSTLDDSVAALFEPGATSPSVRIETIKKTIGAGFLCGICLMPLIPYVSDTKEHLELFFSTFRQCEVDYVLPATLTLFGEGRSDSKVLVFNIIEKHYPELMGKYRRLFSNSQELPYYYRNAFHHKMKELSATFGIRDHIVSLSERR